jgi:hypothetical protein
MEYNQSTSYVISAFREFLIRIHLFNNLPKKYEGDVKYKSLQGKSYLLIHFYQYTD